jgi:hypothetical protein
VGRRYRCSPAIDVLPQGDELDLQALQFIEDFQEVADAAGQAIRRPDQHHIELAMAGGDQLDGGIARDAGWSYIKHRHPGLTAQASLRSALCALPQRLKPISIRPFGTAEAVPFRKQFKQVSFISLSLRSRATGNFQSFLSLSLCLCGEKNSSKSTP